MNLFFHFRKPNLSVSSQSALSAQGAIFPYFTQVDPELIRESDGRDPLGLLPVWSAIGRELVPNLASPVLQANGIRAVLLIHWLAERPRLQKLLTKPGRQRGFVRLMEGIIEYWLKRSDRPICYGSQALVSGGDAFAVDARSGKTVVNGLHQYYRGSCERAGLFNEDWHVDEALGVLFQRSWSDAATSALASALEPYLERGKLLVREVAEQPQIDAGLEAVFTDQSIQQHLRCILGEEKYRALAQTFADLRRPGLALHQRAKLLTSQALSAQIDDMHRCEPFLLVLQDTFDLLRASANERVGAVADRIMPCLPQMRQRAVAFTGLAGKIAKPGPARRMRDLQQLATLLALPRHANEHSTLVEFIEALVRYHRDCMEDRGRDPLIALESELVTVHGDEEHYPENKLARLAASEPAWDNDYYLTAASTIYRQLHGEPV